MTNRNDYTELRTLHDTGEILRGDLGHDEAWIKIRGFVNSEENPLPDDVPIAKNAYLGPFYIYDFD